MSTTTTTCEYVFPNSRPCVITVPHDMHEHQTATHQLPTGVRDGAQPPMVSLKAAIVAFDDQDGPGTTRVLVDLGGETAELRTQAEAEDAVRVLLSLANAVRTLGVQLTPGENGPITKDRIEHEVASRLALTLCAYTEQADPDDGRPRMERGIDIVTAAENAAALTAQAAFIFAHCDDTPPAYIDDADLHATVLLDRITRDTAHLVELQQADGQVPAADAAWATRRLIDTRTRLILGDRP